MEKYKLSEIDDNNLQMNKRDFQKILFINNAIEDGWTVKKDNKNYIFKKKHENKVQVYEQKYLENFIHNNSKI
jgi:hypothetical protein|tara:strand:- start:1075 stop:1293 length:219 start_codon:yes stop_codon:yes gene_type:complete